MEMDKCQVNHADLSYRDLATGQYATCPACSRTYLLVSGKPVDVSTI